MLGGSAAAVLATVTGTVDETGQTFKHVDVNLYGGTLTFAVEGEEQNKYKGTLNADYMISLY